jgi:hypothetical protein
LREDVASALRHLAPAQASCADVVFPRPALSSRA